MTAIECNIQYMYACILSAVLVALFSVHLNVFMIKSYEKVLNDFFYQFTDILPMLFKAFELLQDSYIAY